MNEHELANPPTGISMQEIREVLWGGPQRPGLAYLVAELGKTVADLSQAVSQATLTASEARRELHDLKLNVEAISATMKEFRQIGWRVISYLSLIGVATLLLDGKLMYESFTRMH